MQLANKASKIGLTREFGRTKLRGRLKLSSTVKPDLGNASAGRQLFMKPVPFQEKGHV